MSQSSSIPDATQDNQEMSLIQHLLELRDRLVKAVLAIIVLFLCLFPFANELFTLIAEPLTSHLPQGSSMMAIGVISPFLTPLKLALIASVFFAMPFLLYQLWAFIAPALYQHEKELAAPMIVASTLLFYSGGAFVFYVVFPLVFKFMAGTTPDGVEIGTDIQLYLDFVIGMFFAFGLAFQVPVVTVLLMLIRAVSPEKMRHARPYVIVGAFTIAAFITPPDVISQTLLAVPMWLMYEAGLWFGTRIIASRDAKAAMNEQAPIDPTPTPPALSASVAAGGVAAGGVTAVSAMDMLPDLPSSAVYDYSNTEASTTETSAQNGTTENEAPVDPILNNALETDDDFERAFAEMDQQRSQLDQPINQPTSAVTEAGLDTQKQQS